MIISLVGRIALLLILSGCIAELVRSINDKDLTPEQIDAYKSAGQDVYGCFQAGGPPPAGNTIWIVVPHGTDVKFKFGDNCHLQ